MTHHSGSKWLQIRGPQQTMSLQPHGYPWMPSYLGSVVLSVAPEHMASACSNNNAGKSLGLRCPVCSLHGHVAHNCPTLTSTRRGSKNHLGNLTLQPYHQTIKYARSLIKRVIVFVAPGAHISMCALSAREAIQTRPAPTALKITPINQHTICTPL